MNTFHGMKTYPSRMMLVFFCLLVLQGCTECDDSCQYEPGVVALWSDDNKKITAAITDYGDDKNKKDNKKSVFTYNADGSDVAHLYELESDQFPVHYSSIQNYMILAKSDSNGMGFKKYYRLDLENNNIETLFINDKECFERRILPSLDSSILAVVDITAEITPLTQANGEFDVGCKDLSMKVSYFDANNNEEIITFSDYSINVDYYVTPERFISATINMYWSSQGLIVETSLRSEEFLLLKFDGTTSPYDFPKECYALSTSSSYLSQKNIEAKVFTILDDGLYSEENNVELRDFSKLTSVNDSISEPPSLGKEICVL